MSSDQSTQALTITPIRECGPHSAGRLLATYQEIKNALGDPNVTDLDDPSKVKASWGFKDEQGRKGFIWCYKVDNAETCTRWSIHGDLVRDMFPDRF